MVSYLITYRIHESIILNTDIDFCRKENICLQKKKK
jgi:hypothetical protein